MVAMRGLLPLLMLVAACGVGDNLAPPVEPVRVSPIHLDTPAASTPPSTALTTTTTAAEPLAVDRSSAPAPRERIVIRAVGDVNLWERYAGDDPEATWGPLRALFQSDALTVVNLECTPSTLGTPLAKEFTFRCPVDTLLPMADAGIDVANLANNHSQDFGTEAMLDGRMNVVAAGMAPVGVGTNLAQATEPAIFEIGGWTVAVLGFGGVVPASSWLATEDGPGMASGDDVDVMMDAVHRADEIADLVVVTIHWGWELETTPRQVDVDLAEAMVTAGADMIFGHHQHRLNPLTWVEGRPVAWGLGNFIWQRGVADANRTAIAEVVVEPDGTILACLIPATIVATGIVEPSAQSCVRELPPRI